MAEKEIKAKAPELKGKRGNRYSKGWTLKGPKGGPKRAYQTAGPNRDKPVSRIRLIEELGYDPGPNVIADHVDEDTKEDPKARVVVKSRKQNSKEDGGRRPVKGKKK